jgi:hypothetical protein
VDAPRGESAGGDFTKREKYRNSCAAESTGELKKLVGQPVE